MPPSEQDVLVERLRRYSAERYPVQHATTQFHLGSALLHAGETAAALQALTAAREVFAASGMRLEGAKATVMVGVALRAAGSSAPALDALREAGETLADLGQPAEQAAAAYNLGLVLNDAGDVLGARAAWSSACALFLTAGYPGQAAAAVRDHGASLLTGDDPAAALPLLEQAAALAERAGDDPGTAAAANVLGLAHLAAGDPTAAVTVLRRALGFVPRGVRPAEHAMVKANLALAYEQTAEPARARLAAAQARAVPSADPPVRAQAQQLLLRLPGRLHEDLLTVLDEEARGEWFAAVREEAVRAVDSPVADLRAMVGGFLDGVLARPDAAYDLAEALLAVVLELPPRPFTAMVEAVVHACAGRRPEEADRLRAVLGAALARFAIPQWQRLGASLNAADEAAGRAAAWR